MPVSITFVRPTFGITDSLPPGTFNDHAVVSGIVPDATVGANGVIRLTGDLTGTADSPALTATGVTAATYGATGGTGLKVPTVTVDAKGRVTTASERDIGTAYGKTVIESANEAAARTVLGLAGTTFLDAVYVAVMSRQYPVGEMLITRRSGNPSTWLGFGTWTAYGAGQTLVGYNPGESEFNALDKTGGAKTHPLLEGEIPLHTHSFSGTGTTSLGGAHFHTFTTPQQLSDNDRGAGSSQISVDSFQTSTTSWAVDHTHTVTVAGTTGVSGSGTPHNNLQPYTTVYFWRRTA